MASVWIKRMDKIILKSKLDEIGLGYIGLNLNLPGEVELGKKVVNEYFVRKTRVKKEIKMVKRLKHRMEFGSDVS